MSRTVNIIYCATNIANLFSDNFSVPDKLSALEDQIAMESLDQHLKKITQLPSGFKHKVEADLIRKLTTVSPAPISKHRIKDFRDKVTGDIFYPPVKSAGSDFSQTADGFPDIFIKHKVSSAIM